MNQILILQDSLMKNKNWILANLLYRQTVISDTREFISVCLQALVKRGERHNSEVLMLTILCPPRRVTQLVVSKISTNPCRSRPKLICSDLIRKIQPLASTVEPQLLSSLKS